MIDRKFEQFMLMHPDDGKSGGSAGGTSPSSQQEELRKSFRDDQLDSHSVRVVPPRGTGTQSPRPGTDKGDRL